jgi:hypothetical protein
MSKFPAPSLFGAILVLTALTSEAGEIIDYPQCKKIPDECLEEAILTLQAQLEKLARQQKALNEQIATLKKTIKAQQEEISAFRRVIFRYRDNDDGTVTDNRTGLIWLKNANCFGQQDWETAMLRAAKLAHGQCSLNDSSKAGDWRLPTIDEWKAMMDKRYKNPALSNATGTGKWKEGDAFTGVQSSWYWSSSPSSTSNAWYVYLIDGIVGSNAKAYALYVWAVRGGH